MFKENRYQGGGKSNMAFRTDMGHNGDGEAVKRDDEMGRSEMKMTT